MFLLCYSLIFIIPVEGAGEHPHSDFTPFRKRVSSDRQGLSLYALDPLGAPTDINSTETRIVSFEDAWSDQNARPNGTFVETATNDRNSILKSLPQRLKLSSRKRRQANSLDTPLVYRYYGRNQANTHRTWIPFVLLGPNADHWKAAAQYLSASGFSAIACETDATDQESSAHVIGRLMNALRWKKVILVACDNESLLAIEAAKELAPHRVAGLVLCGRVPKIQDMDLVDGEIALDPFLETVVPCPFTILWDGAFPELPIVYDEDGSYGTVSPLHRTLLLGGGSAPHRRQPELFAWTLTRFVEERIYPVDVALKTPERQENTSCLPFSLHKVLNAECLVVIGRIAATMLLYGIAFHILSMQLGFFHSGMLKTGNRLQKLSLVPGTVGRLFLIPVEKARNVPRTFVQWLSNMYNTVKSIPSFIFSGPANLVLSVFELFSSRFESSPSDTVTADESELDDTEISEEDDGDNAEDSEDDDDDESLEQDNSVKSPNATIPEAPVPPPLRLLDHVVV